MKAMIFDIQRSSVVDGPGIRTTVFFKGCNLRCAWCHNPESQKPEREMMYYRDLCTGCGACRAVCHLSQKSCDLCGACETVCQRSARRICGREYSVDEVMDEVRRDKVFYDNSGGGVTFSGGECMLQIDFLSELTRRCREENIQTAVDTAGNVPWSYIEKVLPYTDMFLFDIKCMDAEKHKEGTGVSNDRILDNLKKLSETDVRILIRIPVIGGYNDSEEEMQAIASFLRTIPHDAAELLPYHKMGESKCAAIGREAVSFTVPDEEEMARFRRMIQ